jgi:hypothetical protein
MAGKAISLECLMASRQCARVNEPIGVRQCKGSKDDGRCDKNKKWFQQLPPVPEEKYGNNMD